MRKPILHVQLSEEKSDAIADVLGNLWPMVEKDYHLIVSTGRDQFIKVLSARKMKRADYQATVNAAKRIMR